MQVEPLIFLDKCPRCQHNWHGLRCQNVANFYDASTARIRSVQCPCESASEVTF